MGLFSGRLIFGGAYYWRECASKWVWLDNNNKDNGVNIREGLLSEGYLRLRFGAAYFRGGGGVLLIGILQYSTKTKFDRHVEEDVVNIALYRKKQGR